MTTTKHTIVSLIIIFLLHFQPSFCHSVLKEEPHKGTLGDTASYKVTIKGIDTAFVEYRFTVADSILFMSDQGANQLEKGWATFIREPRVLSEDGKEISIAPVEGGRWAMNAKRGQVVTLHYQVLLDHESHDWSAGIDGVAYKKSYGVFYTGRSLFIMGANTSKEISVDFDLPHDWKITTVWDPTQSGTHSFKVKSYSELTESMLFAGEHERLTLERNGFELIFALGGDEMISKKKEYEDLARGVLDYYIELMGGVPRSTPVNPFHRALVILNPSDRTDGEVIGNSISILQAEEGDAMSQLISRFLFAHELFHLWNGKSFFPSDERCEWFKEGVTNYYTIKSLYHAKVLNEESYFNVLNGFFYQKYLADPGVGNMSITQGNEKHDHWGLIYSGGLFAGISQDMIVRSSTRNKKSLDDLMRSLFEIYGGTGQSYSLEDIEKGLSALSGSDPSKFFTAYVKGTEKIPVDDYLKLSGLLVEVQENQLRILRKQKETPLETKMINGLLGKN